MTVALLTTGACSIDVGGEPSVESYTPPTCGQTCQDYLTGFGLDETVWLLYNQNVAGTSAGNVDVTTACPISGTAHITGTTAVASDGTNTVHLTFDLTSCKNISSTYSLTFQGPVTMDGTFNNGSKGAAKFTTVTLRSQSITIFGTLTYLDDPQIEETGSLAETRQDSGASGTLDGQVNDREFSSDTALTNSGSSSGAGGGSSSSSGLGGATGLGAGTGLGCPSVYDGTYIGQFAYDWTTTDSPPSSGTGSFNLTLVLQCLATADGIVTLNITHATASEPYFGCQVGGCTPNQGSVALLPAAPPTSPSSPSQSGEGVAILFPNGSTLGTENSSGDLNVTSSGATLSNALTGSTSTWVAASTASTIAFPDASRSVTSFKSWSLTKSAQ